jgi:hypothetical protein
LAAYRQCLAEYERCFAVPVRWDENHHEGVVTARAANQIWDVIGNLTGGKQSAKLRLDHNTWQRRLAPPALQVGPRSRGSPNLCMPRRTLARLKPGALNKGIHGRPGTRQRAQPRKTSRYDHFRLPNQSMAQQHRQQAARSSD